MLRRMYFKLKRLSPMSQRKRVKSQKRNGTQLQKKVIWKLKEKDQREEWDMTENVNWKMHKIEIILIIKTSWFLFIIKLKYF